MYARVKRLKKQGKPRRNAAPFWRRLWFTGFLIVSFSACFLVGGWWIFNSGWIGKKIERLEWAGISLLSKSGFKLSQILVVGRAQTSQSDLRKALRLSVGAPLLNYDLEAAKKRIEALPWIRQVRVKRMLPNTILLSISESRALAIWQNKGKFSLINEQGEEIKVSDLRKFNSLMVVVGKDAPTNTRSLFSFLKTEPALYRQVKAAVWVSGRRWNLKMEGEINVRLPEKDPAAAWAKLAEYERIHKILNKNIQSLDLRIADRLIIRKKGDAPKGKKSPGQET